MMLVSPTEDGSLIIAHCALSDPSIEFVRRALKISADLDEGEDYPHANVDAFRCIERLVADGDLDELADDMNRFGLDKATPEMFKNWEPHKTVWAPAAFAPDTHYEVIYYAS